MNRSGGRLTAQEEQFVKRVVEDGFSLVAAYRLSYPPRNGTRSAVAERVAAKRVAHRPVVEQRMEELREELLASDPVEMRRRANAVLGRILTKRQDPRYRRTALDVLHYLDQQERAAEKAEWESYRTAVAQIAAADAMEGGRKNRARFQREQTIVGAGHECAIEQSRIVTEETAGNAERQRGEIGKVIADRRRKHSGEKFESHHVEARLDDPPPPVTKVVIEKKGKAVEWVRKPGYFGRGGWMRLPDAH
jgi:hypothetical protein